MAVENVTVNFEDGSTRQFGNCAWRWNDGVLTIMEFVDDPEHGRRSVPTFQAPYEAVQCIDIEYAEKESSK